MKSKLNLIPPSRKEEIKKSFRLRAIWRWESELFLVFLVFIAVLVSMHYILKLNLSIAESAVNSLANNDEQYKEIEKYDAEMKNTNALINKLNKIQNSQLYWSNFLAKFNDKVPLGIEITKLSTQNYTISVFGKADTRDNLISFRDNLGRDECFADVDLPLSNLVSRDNIDFQMNLTVKKECLK